MDFIQDFVLKMSHYGLTIDPAMVEADDKWHRFHVDGDKKNAPTGSYRLAINNDFAFGNFGSFRLGVKVDYSSRHPSTNRSKPFDDTAYRIRKEQQEKLAEANAQNAAKKAQEEWAAGKVENHPYAERKLIPMLGARVIHTDQAYIIVPLYRDGRIIGRQKINEAGEKRYSYRCDKKGAYAPIGSPGDYSKFIICEGWATGVSINVATGLPVVCAFDAGSLMDVSLAIRAKYPEASIIIAADNDVYRKDGNIGIIKANEAAKEINATVAYPVFDECMKEEKYTDFNDAYLAYGEEWVKERILNPRIEEPDYIDTQIKKELASHAARHDWKSKLNPGKVKALGFPYDYDGKSPQNAYLFIKNHEDLAGMVIYDEFADDVKIVQCPPWDDNSTFSPRSVHETDFFMLMAHMESYGIKLPKNTIADAFMRVAYTNKTNPAKEYMESLQWDGAQRLNNWLFDYAGAVNADNTYLESVGSKWMIGAVKRIYEPGCKFDTVLVLEGEQGLGKSTILRELATLGGQEYFLDNVGDIRNKDTVMAMQGHLIIEMAELASFKKVENEEIKGFITRQTDVYRPPYARTIAKRKRMFVLAASTNEGESDGYLTDATGNRRYWPVSCGKIDYDGIKKHREQLWAEAVHRYKKGEATWLDMNQMQGAVVEQNKRYVEDAWQDKVASIVGASTMVVEWTLDEICKELDINQRDINNFVKGRLKKCLKVIGWHEVRREKDGATKRMWVKK